MVNPILGGEGLKQLIPRPAAAAGGPAPASRRDAYIATNPRPVGEDDVRGICVAAY